ncbi:MAG: peptidylprolyl isomerase [Candidatus Edwardsbacteria bacterium]|jgi:parvulin-like peptidyl-prolyl isomerase|nr:peptidylprolyl isomerase [Candidatus Edwardsbacteria bacterium]
MMKRLVIAALVAASAVALAGCGKTGSKGQVIARVNKAALTDQDFYDMLPQEFAGMQPAYKEAWIAANKDEAIKQWVRTELLYQEALKRGVHKEPKIAKVLKEWPKIILMNEMEKRALADVAVTEAEAREYFTAHEQEYQTEVKLAEIVVATKADADAVKAALDNGADFAKLARERSLARNTAASGGELPAYLLRGDKRIDFELEEKIFALAKGKVSEPVKIANAYQVIKAVDRRPAWQTVKFDDIKEDLIGGLTIARQRRLLEQLFDSLQAKAAVVKHPELLK